MTNEKLLIAVVGPTAIGKTKLAIQLAKYFAAEIISADSRQFFREMNIGTAVPSKEELEQAKHHFIQHKSIHENYSVGDFEREAIQLITKLFQKHNTVILAGGSGLYVDAIARGLDEFPKVDSSIRKALNERLENNGLKDLQDELQKRDPIYFGQVDIDNPHRIIRALEICIGSGKPYSSFLNQKKNHRPFRTLYVGLTADRKLIYDRINQRVDLMLKNGLLEEAKTLWPHKSLNALQTVGYKELFSYFDQECELDFAIEEIKKNTRRFSKRQQTWYRKNGNILWVEFDEKFDSIINKLTNKQN